MNPNLHKVRIKRLRNQNLHVFQQKFPKISKNAGENFLSDTQHLIYLECFGK